MASIFIREIPIKTFKERIQFPSILYFFSILFLHLIGLNVPDLNYVYLAFISCCILIIWVIQVILVQKNWFYKIEINENELILFGFSFNRTIHLHIPFENYAISVDYNNRIHIHPDFYVLRLKSNNKIHIFNLTNDWNDPLMFEIVNELKKWRDSKPFLIDGIHYLNNLEK